MRCVLINRCGGIMCQRHVNQLWYNREWSHEKTEKVEETDKSHKQYNHYGKYEGNYRRII